MSMYGGENKPNQQQQTTEHASPYRLQSPYQPEHKDLVVKRVDKEENPLLFDDEVYYADVVNDIVYLLQNYMTSLFL